MKKYLFLCLFALTAYLVQAQAPQSINYQAVARDANGVAVPNQSISLQISFFQGTVGGTPVYQEQFFTTTNALGLYNLRLGEGMPVSGTFAGIDWANGPYEVQVEADLSGGTNYTPVGVTELSSVPYALMATEVVNKDDADADPTNEIQQLSISNDTVTISDGNFIVLPPGTMDTDDQNLLLSNDSLLIQDGNGVDLSGFRDNTDTQILTLNGQDLSISNGNTITLPDQVNDADADPANELQQLSLTGQTLSLSGGNSVTLPDQVNDADPDPINELQQLSISGDTILISSGNSIVLPPGTVDTDEQSLSLSNDSLLIDDGNGVDLSIFRDNTDAQTLTWDSTTQELTLSNGNTVSLGSLVPAGGGGNSGGSGIYEPEDFMAKDFPVDWSGVQSNTDVILANGETRAWGFNSSSRFGVGQATVPFLDPTWSPLPDSVAAIVQELRVTFWLLENGQLWSAGANSSGLTGVGTFSGTSFYPRRVANLSNITKVVVSQYNGSTSITGAACALRDNGKVFCWGNDEQGVLGNGSNTADQSIPLEVPGISNITDLFMSGGGNASSVLAVQNDTMVWSWGNNNSGELGNGNNVDQNSPVLAFTTASPIEKIISAHFTASHHTRLMLLEDGTVWAWGRNTFGQLGNGTTTDSRIPVQINFPGGALIEDIFVGGGYRASAFAIDSTGQLYAWGDNQSGQLGLGNTTNSSSPQLVNSMSGIPVQRVVVSKGGATGPGGAGVSTHALTRDGRVFSTGYNGNGNLGQGTNTPLNSFQQILTVRNAVRLYSGGVSTFNHTCVILEDGRVRCWGEGASGQLGNGQTQDSWVPAAVQGLED